MSEGTPPPDDSRHGEGEVETFGEAWRRLRLAVDELVRVVSDIMTKHERKIWLLDMSLGGILLLWFSIDLWPSEWSILIGLIGCLSVYLFVLVWTDG